MKTIKKVDPKAAQSVFSFACPCLDYCYTCTSCNCAGVPEFAQTAFNVIKTGQSLLSRYGTQTVNYN